MVTNISLLLSKGDLGIFRSEILKLSHPRATYVQCPQIGNIHLPCKGKIYCKISFSIQYPSIFLDVSNVRYYLYIFFQGHESNMRLTIQKHKLSKNINCYFCLKIFYYWSRQTIKDQVNIISTARYPSQSKSKINLRILKKKIRIPVLGINQKQ